MKAVGPLFHMKPPLRSSGQSGGCVRWLLFALMTPLTETGSWNAKIGNERGHNLKNCCFEYMSKLDLHFENLCQNPFVPFVFICPLTKEGSVGLLGLLKLESLFPGRPTAGSPFVEMHPFRYDINLIYLYRFWQIKSKCTLFFSNVNVFLQVKQHFFSYNLRNVFQLCLFIRNFTQSSTD